jgi:tripartite-type tricarboxylate transporter receptor subunit TctC
MLSRRSVIAGLAANAVALPAMAEWPEKNITLLHGLAPGGGLDITARLLADGLSRKLGKAVVVESKPGAGTTLASTQTARAEPDGYQLAVIASSFSGSAALYKELSYRPMEDFSFISLVTQSPFIIANNAESDVATFPQFLEKSRSGQIITYGTSGVGSGAHLTMEYINQLAGVKFQHVPFRGGAPIITEILGKRIDLMVDPPLSMMEQFKAGKMRPVAVTTSQRFSAFPNVPAVAEAGLPNLDVSAWFGLAGPSGLSDAMIKRLHDVSAEVLSEDAVKEKFRELGSSAGSSTPKEFKDLVAADIARWTSVIDKANIARI